MSTERRKPRVLSLALPTEKRPLLIFEGMAYPIRNLSEKGMGVWVPATKVDKNQVPAPEKTVSGEVSFVQKRFPVKWQVVHLTDGVMGIEFSEMPQELKTIFEKLLEPARYAASLKFIPPVKDELATGDQKMIYQGDAGSQLIIWFNPFQKMVSAVQVVCLGKWAYRKLYGTAQTGNFKNPADLNSDLILHKQPNPEIWQQAAQFLTSLPHPLPESVLWQFFEMGEQVYLPEDFIPKREVG